MRWMTWEALHHPWRLLALLGLNLLMLGLEVWGLNLTGSMIDVLRYAVDEKAPYPKMPKGMILPTDWSAIHVVLVIGVGIIVLAILRGAVAFTTALANGGLVQSILTRLRTKVYDKLQRLSFRFFDANETGSLINRATSDVNGVSMFAEFALIQVVMLAVRLAVYLLYMVNIHTSLTLIALATTPLLLVASVLFTRMVRPAYDKNRKLYDKMVLALSENIKGHHVVKGFALERREIEKFRTANDDLRQQQRWLFKRSAGYAALVSMLAQLNLVVVVLVGGYIIITHRDTLTPPLTVGGLIIFTSLLNRFSNQISAVANVANTLSQSLTAAGRVYEVLQAPIDIQSKPNALPLPKAMGRVVFENVSFGYKAEEPVLHEVSFEAKPGQCIAILGATGSGKSTLLSLIPRFYDPDQGQIKVDDMDIRDINLDHLRRNIGLVFQESFLFSNSVAANISFGHPGATQEQIETAAKIAKAHDFIMELDKGYATVIGEQGSTLSGGQRQRLAIARAIVLEPTILILDDATASIDPETEHEIMAAMDAAMQGRTTFVVAHRLSTLRRADLVLVLDRGRIVQRGTHDELMQTDGHYRAVARMQVADLASQWIIQARKWYQGEANTPIPDPEKLS